MTATIAHLPTVPNCQRTGANPEEWFPPEDFVDEKTGRAQYEENARKLCADCPIEAACLDQALADEARYGVKRHGIFGGYAPWERKAMHRSELRRSHEYANHVRDDRRRTA